MTTTTDRATRTAAPQPSTPHRADPSSRRTLIAMVATGLGVVPLKGLFSDWGWLIDVWLTMIVVLGPAAWLRRRRPAGALDIWPGIVLMIPWLTVSFVRAHAIGGFIPGPATWHDVSLLLVDLHHTTRNSVAPIHTTVAVRLVVCALLGLVAALVDLVTVVGRRGALAGVPLLVVYTVAGAVPRHPVSWFWFAFAALGFMLLLGLDAGDVLSSWGRRIRPADARRTAKALSVTTPRIAIGAVIIAIAVPLLVPARASNLISDAFHGGSGSGGTASGIAGFGGNQYGSIAPFAALKGQLVRPSPETLMTVRMQGDPQLQPFYLRVNVLADYTGQQWQAASHGSTDRIDTSGDPYPTEGGIGTSVAMTAHISLTDQVRGNAPVFAVPTSITGLSSDTTWSPQDEILLGHDISGRTDYTESFEQPAPTAASLNAAGDSVDAGAVGGYLSLPADLPHYVTRLVGRLTGRSRTLYERALAINDYFTDPANGFVYSLQTKVGDSGSELEDFLKNKEGYCQQYAASEAVMFRAAGVPSRVVLGYMHHATDKAGSFTVTTSDAHAWVEAYFPGQGWIPFDPTPSDGLAGNGKTDLAWAPHKNLAKSNPGDGIQTAPKATRHSKASVAPKSVTPTTRAPRAVQRARSTSVSWAPVWWIVAALVVLILAFVPASIRLARRRSRLTATRRGDPGALWAELRDSVVDLGYGWSDARTPQQVARWLSRDASESAPWFARLASAVEQQRYSGRTHRPADWSDLVDGLAPALRHLAAHRSRAVRWRAVLAAPTVVSRRRQARPGGLARPVTRFARRA